MHESILDIIYGGGTMPRLPHPDTSEE